MLNFLWIYSLELSSLLVIIKGPSSSRGKEPLIGGFLSASLIVCSSLLQQFVYFDILDCTYDIY
ncbi:hypothetical protein Scep_027678 [Stephania cephalantha]|uniref:Uncharacterized protein n=1 Tax=Stephania cephalantha TaxID=152367 RepID=A0AAP0E8H1_9MAGN